MAAQADGLFGLYQQVKAVGYGIWRKRWAMLATAWLVSLVGWAITLSMPLNYAADARVSINTDTLTPEVAKRLGIDLKVAKKLEQVRKTLITRKNMQTIITRTDQLDKLVSGNAAVENAIIRQMTNDIRVIQLDKNNFRITYKNNDSRLSERDRAIVVKTVVDNLISLYQLGASASSAGETASTRDELERQLRGLQDQANAALEAQTHFKSTNFELLGDIKFSSRRGSAAKELKKTRDEISELEIREETLNIQLKNTPATIRQARSASRGKTDEDPLLTRIAEHTKKLDDLYTAGFKPSWPDAARLNQLIEQLQTQYDAKQEKIAAELSGSLEAGQTSTLTTTTPNPLYEELFRNKIGIQTDIDQLKQRESNQKNDVDSLTAKAEQVPVLRAEEGRLKEAYRGLRKRTRQIQEEIDKLGLREGFQSTTESLAFSLVDAPVIPANADGPNRMLFYVSSYAFSFVVGLGVAFMLAQLRPVIITVEQLRAQFDMPVLGNVTRLLSEEETRNQKLNMLGFGGAFMLLFLIFILLVIAEVFQLKPFG